MSTKEIITLQFGHYANYVGAHWWNIQELGFSYDPATPSDINHEILFREGKTSRNETTFTPRLLLVDLKDSLKTLPIDGNLYDPVVPPDKAIQMFDDIPIEQTIAEKVPKNQFLSDIESSSGATRQEYCLEKDVIVWSDFLYARFHPRTINIVNKYRHNDDKTPFDTYPLGVDLWKTAQFTDEFSDKIQNYMEECDSNQGFQILLDSTNAFSGLATSCIEHLKDEYERKSIFALPLLPTHYPDVEQEDKNIADSVRTLNLAFTFAALAENSSLFVPLSLGETGWRQPGAPRRFNHVNYDSQLPYHTSAVLASALDTFTLKHRLRNTQYVLSDLCADFNGYGRKAAAASLCLPFSINADADLIDCLDNWDGPLWKSVTPNCTVDTNRMLQSVTLRGVPETRLKQPAAQRAEHQRDLPAYKCETVEEMLQMYLTCNSYASATSVTTSATPLAVKTPYPNIFDDRVGVEGDVVDKATQRQQSVPALSGLHSGLCVGDMLESFNMDVERIKFQRFHQFKNAGMENDEFVECVEKLKTLRECYEDDYQL